jgi:hypothetical protein
MCKFNIKKKKRNNGNLSPSPIILEKESFLQVNNKLYLLVLLLTILLILFFLLLYQSSALDYSENTQIIIDFDRNKEDMIDTLLKLRDNVLMEKDVNSVMYELLSQINPQRYENKTLMHTYDPYYFLNDQEFNFIYNNLEILIFKIKIYIL